ACVLPRPPPAPTLFPYTTLFRSLLPSRLSFSVQGEHVREVRPGVHTLRPAFCGWRVGDVALLELPAQQGQLFVHATPPRPVGPLEGAALPDDREGVRVRVDHLAVPVGERLPVLDQNRLRFSGVDVHLELLPNTGQGLLCLLPSDHSAFSLDPLNRRVDPPSASTWYQPSKYSPPGASDDVAMNCGATT